MRVPSYERWFTNALGRVSGVPPPDLNHERIQFIKARILDIEFGRLPEGEYHAEFGPSRWTGIARRMTTRTTEVGAEELHSDDDDEHEGDHGYDEAHHADGDGYAVEGWDARDGSASYYHGDDATGARPDGMEGHREGRVRAVPPPSSSRAAALSAAAKRASGPPPRSQGAVPPALVPPDVAYELNAYDDDDLMEPGEVDFFDPPPADDAVAPEAEAEPEPDWLREAAVHVGIAPSEATLTLFDR